VERVVPIYWDIDDYDTTSIEPQTITGEIILPQGITNPDNLKFEVEMHKHYGIVDGYVRDDITIEVPYNEEYELPAQLSINYHLSRDPDKTFNFVADIDWDTSNVNVERPDTYEITGHIVMQDGRAILNLNDVTVKATVIVDKRWIVAYDLTDRIEVYYETPKGQVPLSDIVGVELSDETGHNFNVKWDFSDYDPSTPDDYLIAGTVSTDDVTDNRLGIQPSIIVSVQNEVVDQDYFAHKHNVIEDLDGNQYALDAIAQTSSTLNGDAGVSVDVHSNLANDLFIDRIDKMWTFIDHDQVRHKITYLERKGVGHMDEVPDYVDSDIPDNYLTHDGENYDRGYISVSTGLDLPSDTASIRTRGFTELYKARYIISNQSQLDNTRFRIRLYDDKQAYLDDGGVTVLNNGDSFVLDNLDGIAKYLRAYFSHDDGLDFDMLGDELQAKVEISDTETKWIPSIADGYTGDVVLKDKRQFVSFQAVPEFYDVMATKWEHTEYNRNFTAQLLFNRIFEGTGYQPILHANLGSLLWEGMGNEFRIDMFQKAIDRYNVEFEIIGKSVHIRKQVGKKIPQAYRYQLNADEITATTDAKGLSTFGRIYADYEDSGQDDDGNKTGGWENANLIIDYTSPLAKLYGIREIEPIKDGRITNRTTAYNNIRKKVLDSYEISVTANLISLERSGIDVANLRVGDTIPLIDERINFNHDVRIINIDKTEDNGRITDINATLGTLDLAKRYASSMQSVSSRVDDIYDGNAQLPPSVLPPYVLNATNILNNSQSEITWARDGSLLWYDKTDHSKVFRINSQGWGLSKNGGESYGYALTHDGMNLDFVVAGHLLADRVQGGILSSINGNTVFNLNRGDLFMERANFELGNGADIEFTDPGNRLYYARRDSQGSRLTRSAGVGFGRSINNRFPYAFLGTSTSSKPHPKDDDNFNGFITNTYQRRIEDGIGNSVVGHIFQIRDKAVSFNKGFQFDLVGNTLVFRGISSGSYNYHIGTRNNQFRRAFIQDIRSSTGYIRFRNSSSSYTNQGFTMETTYDGDDQLAFRGTHSDEHYNLGKPGWRFSYIYLRYNPNVQSDERLKTGIKPVEKATEIISKLKPITYRFKQTNKDLLLKNEGNMERGLPVAQFGFSAQQVESVLLDLGIEDHSIVKRNEDNYYGMQHQQIIPLLVADNQDLRQEINELKEIVING